MPKRYLTIKNKNTGAVLRTLWDHPRPPSEADIDAMFAQQDAENANKMAQVKEPEPGIVSQIGSKARDAAIYGLGLYDWHPVESAKSLGRGLKGIVTGEEHPEADFPRVASTLEAVRGAGGIVGPPLMAAGTVINPLATGAFVAGSEAAKRGSQALVEKLGGNQELGELGSDLLGLGVGGKLGSRFIKPSVPGLTPRTINVSAREVPPERTQLPPGTSTALVPQNRGISVPEEPINVRMPSEPINQPGPVPAGMLNRSSMPEGLTGVSFQSPEPFTQVRTPIEEVNPFATGGYRIQPTPEVIPEVKSPEIPLTPEERLSQPQMGQVIRPENEVKTPKVEIMGPDYTEPKKPLGPAEEVKTPDDLAFERYEKFYDELTPEEKSQIDREVGLPESNQRFPKSTLPKESPKAEVTETPKTEVPETKAIEKVPEKAPEAFDANKTLVEAAGGKYKGTKDGIVWFDDENGSTNGIRESELSLSKIQEELGKSKERFKSVTPEVLPKGEPKPGTYGSVTRDTKPIQEYKTTATEVKSPEEDLPRTQIMSRKELSVKSPEQELEAPRVSNPEVPEKSSVVDEGTIFDKSLKEDSPEFQQALSDYLKYKIGTREDLIKDLQEYRGLTKSQASQIVYKMNKRGVKLSSGIDPFEALKSIKDLGSDVKDFVTNSSFARTFINSGEHTLKSFGEAGTKLADALRDFRTRHEVQAGIWETYYLKKIEGFSKEQLDSLVDSLRGNPSSDPKIIEATKQIRNLLDLIHREAVKAGVKEKAFGEEIPTQYRENYFPLKFPKDFLKDRGMQKTLAEKLVKAGEFKTESEAIDFLDNIVRPRAEKFVAGSLQRPRLLQMLEAYGRKDPAVLLEYIRDASRKIWEVKSFGNKATNSSLPQGIYDLLEGIRKQNGTDEFNKAEQIVDLFYEPNPLRGLERQVMKHLTSFQAATKLGQAVIANATQHVNTAYVTGVTNWVKAIAKVLSDYGNSKEAASRAGNISLDILKEYERMAGVEEQSIGSKILSATGFTHAERINRIVTTVAAKYGVEDAFNALKKDPTNKRVRRQLSHFYGLDADTLLSKGLTENDRLIAEHTLSDRTQFRSGSLELPSAAMDSLTGRLIYQFKSFMMNQSKLMKDAVIKELGHGNFRPLIPLLTVVPALGYTINSLKNLINGTKDDEKANLIEKIADIYGNVGAISGLGDALKLGAWGKGVGFIAGPTVSDVGDVLNIARAKDKVKQTSKEVVKRIPVVGRPIYNRIWPFRQSNPTGNGLPRLP